MKKFLFLAAMLLLACLPLTSCGGDDEPQPTITTTATYLMTFSQDLLEACKGSNGGIFLTYKAKNGDVVKTSVDKPTWSQTVTSGFPAEFGVYYEFSTNADELKKDKYNLTCKLTFNVTTSDGRTKTERNETIIDMTEVAKADVKKVLDGVSKQSKGWRVTSDYNTPSDNNLRY